MRRCRAQRDDAGWQRRYSAASAQPPDDTALRVDSLGKTLDIATPSAGLRRERLAVPQAGCENPFCTAAALR